MISAARSGSCPFVLSVTTLAVLGLACTAFGQSGGQWVLAQPEDWRFPGPDPLTANEGESIHAIHLHTGQIMLIEDQVFDAPSTVRLYDPVLASFTPEPITEPDPEDAHGLFCAGHVQLADGSLFVACGTDNGNVGARWAHIYSHGEWLEDPLHPPDITYGRFYPTCVLLPYGRVLVLGGVTDGGTFGCTVDIPEIYDRHVGPAGDWAPLPSAEQDVGQYPHAYLLRDRRIAVVGAYEDQVQCNNPAICDGEPCTDHSITRFLDLETNTWTDGPSAGWSGLFSSSVMYGPDLVLRTGGNDATMGDVATDRAATIDLGQLEPAWNDAPFMNFPRKEHTLVLLPNGRVLAVGGTDEMALFVKEAEWIDLSDEFPAWDDLAPMALGRSHHISAALLPDGTVLVAGETEDADPPTAEYNPRGEIFLPPYKFAGTPPQIASAPAIIDYGAVFTVEVASASPSIGMVTLLRLAASTHSFDQNQRFVSLDFAEVDPTTFDVTAPAPRGSSGTECSTCRHATVPEVRSSADHRLSTSASGACKDTSCG